MKNKIIELLQEARSNILEASNLIKEIEVCEKVGEKYEITEEFERSVLGIYQISEAVNSITTDRKEKGSLDILKEDIKGRLKTFFSENHKQKKYEGDIMEIGYTVTPRKKITDEAEDIFVKIERKPNTKAINEYLKATKSEENPDGVLPKGVIEKTFEYITYKPVKNEEA